MIRPVELTDAPAICKIYNHYIEHTVVSFEEQTVTNEEMERRITTVLTENLPWLVLEEADALIGYAYAGNWRERSAYRFSVESTVYLDVSVTRQGYGTLLYTHLLAELRTRPVHAVMGGITLPNAASVALHEKCGFVKVAHFPQVGRKFEQWLDVGYWQLLL